MSLPPQIIQVKRLKRKARDDDDAADGVVDYLRSCLPHLYPKDYLWLTTPQESMATGNDIVATRTSTNAPLPPRFTTRPSLRPNSKRRATPFPSYTHRNQNPRRKRTLRRPRVLRNKSKNPQRPSRSNQRAKMEMLTGSARRVAQPQLPNLVVSTSPGRFLRPHLSATLLVLPQERDRTLTMRLQFSWSEGTKEQEQRTCT